MEKTGLSQQIRFVFLTNMLAPYWKPVLLCLAQRFAATRVLVSTRTEPNRGWECDWAGLDVVVQRTITLRGRWRHPRGFKEPLFVHLPLDTVHQLRRFRATLVFSAEMGFRTALAVLYRRLVPTSRLMVWAEISDVTERGRGLARHLVRRLLRRHIDIFLTPGESGRRYLRRLGVAENRIRKVPYATDVVRFQNAEIARHGDTAWRLLYVGQLIERKGLLPFLHVLSAWAIANPERNISLVLAGEGPLRIRIEAFSVPPNLHVALTGNIAYAEIATLYAQSGIFVFPTLADTWGVVVNEAMAAGLPVLGSEYSQAVEELVEEGRDGWRFLPDNPASMRRAVDKSLAATEEELNAMRVHARATALRLSPCFIASAIEAAGLSCERTAPAK